MSCNDAIGWGMDNPKTWDGIDGVPAKYGSPGNYNRITVSSETGFHAKLVEWMQSLKYFSKTFAGSWFDQIEWIGHAGAFTQKNGCHGQGKAFDLNYVKWNGYELNIFGHDHLSGDRTRRRRYLAVDASVRRYFKFTLDGWFDDAHKNHIHMDTHTTPLFNRGHTSDVKFVQAVCNNFNGAGLAIDGSWGPSCQDAFEKINREWGYPESCSPSNNEGHWREWCAQVMRHGFKDVTAGYYNSLCNEPA